MTGCLQLRVFKPASVNKAAGNRRGNRKQVLHIVSEIGHKHGIVFGRVQDIAELMRRATNDTQFFPM